MARWTAFRQTRESGTVANQLDHYQLKKQAIFTANPEDLLYSVHVSQNITLRGHDESEDSNNKGNFCHYLSQGSNTFRSRYDNAPLNVKHTSKEIQNDLLDAAPKVKLF